MTTEARPDNDLLLYRSMDGAVRVSVLFREESFWMWQENTAELFGVTVASNSRHLKNILESTKLAEESVVTVIETTAADDQQYKTHYYSQGKDGGE